MNSYTQEKEIGSINVEARYRKDLGDIEGLAQSINEVGLLHPVVITADGRLIAGQRRLEACKSLGWSKIPVTIVDLKDILRGQTDENSVRKDLTPREAVATAMVIEPEVKKEASQHQTDQTGEKLEPSGGKLPPGTGKTRDKLARLVGMSGRTLEKATQVVNAAQHDPEKYSYLVRQMDAQGKVDGAFRELQRLQNRNSVVTTLTGSAEEVLFDVILAIPPWTGGYQENDAVVDTEPPQLMSVKDIKNLKLPIATDAVLFVQTLPQNLPSALELLGAWTFEYKTLQVWSYLNLVSSGLVMGIHHAVLIGVKGNHPASILKNLTSSITPVKPFLVSNTPTVYDRIERIFPTGKYLEVFTRSNRRDWTSWPPIEERDKGLEN